MIAAEELRWWQNFEKVVERAKTAAHNEGFNVRTLFMQTHKKAGGRPQTESSDPADSFPDSCHSPMRIFTDGPNRRPPNMTTNDDQDDDGQPRTTAAAECDETEIGPAAAETELVPQLTVAASELAWSRAEDGDTGGEYSWGRAAERASIIVIAAAAVAVAIALLIWLGFHLHDQTKPTAAPGTVRPVTIEPAAAAPPPPSTVTVTPAPPATVTVQAAQPPPPPAPAPAVKPAPALPPPGGTDVFTICPDGHEGVVGGHTTCAFAENVRRAFYNSGMANTFTAYSPITGDAYEMTCAGRYPAYFTDGSTTISTRCYGGDNAEVVIW